ncbi:MAG TPA: hypothetical protein VLA96_09830 [Terriglobales bacterium]|nr:hypothetical protein [Terriglobales bacterium]
MRRRPFAVTLILLSLTVVALAASKGTATNTFVQPNLSLTGAGVSHDGNNAYLNGASGVQSYLGAGGKNANLVTYSTGRRMRFIFDPASPAWQASGLPQNFLAEVSAFGVNYFGPYVSMGPGTTAQVALTIQFKYNNVTYELAYGSVAAYHDTATSWLLTWTSFDLPGYPGFSPSDQATLSRLRNNQRTRFGAVNMPVRYSVQLA